MIFTKQIYILRDHNYQINSYKCINNTDIYGTVLSFIFNNETIKHLINLTRS